MGNKRVRLPGWQLSPDVTHRVVALYHQGYTVTMLAIRFGKSDDWVRRQVALQAADSSTTAMPPRALTGSLAPASL